jgi:subtilisin-like proprotein convertase family protein
LGFGENHSTAIPIPPGPAVVSSTIDFQRLTSFESICEVRVITEITHSFAADLDITLTSPAGTVATLTSDNGSDNDDVFDGTFWLDVADSDGQVPYVTNDNLTTDHPYADGTTATPLVPEEGMGAFKGEDAIGTWTLTISDDRAGDGGTLHFWSIGVFPCSCTRGVGPRRADAHASGGVSNVNGVAEPGERFLFEPRVANAGGSFIENFEQAIPPVLPPVWGVNLAVGQSGDQPWRTVSTMSDSPPHSAFAANPGHVTDNRLHFPSLPVNLSNRILQFRHYFDMQKPFDGGVLEISIGGGPFQDVGAAGGLFLLGGYTSVISGATGSPIAGRMAWSGESGGYITTRVFLPAAAVGNTVVLRFRAATDNSVAGVGWSIDNVSLGNFNTSAATTAESAGLGGPPGPVYTVHDDSASYGVPFPGASNSCFDATGDCYELEVSNPPVRPALHWDATLGEFLSPGNNVVHSIHIGASFADVSVASPFYRFIETLLHFGITGGCGPTTYCPGSNVLREQMAVFLLVARVGTGHTPPACAAPVFGDVPCSHPFAAWINQLAALGITGGCGGGNFCPASPVLREQMAVFLLVAYEGTGYVPPACTSPMFADVPCASIYSRWINELARRQVTGGCGGGNFCPAQAVAREQMAVFLTQTFALHLY